MILTVGAPSGPKVELLLPRLWFRHLSLITSTMGNHSEFSRMLDDVNIHQLNKEGTLSRDRIVLLG